MVDALDSIGTYDKNRLGKPPLVPEQLFQGIEKFQADNGLKVDGIVNRDGPTLRTINEQAPLKIERPRVQHPVWSLRDVKRPANLRDYDVVGQKTPNVINSALMPMTPPIEPPSPNPPSPRKVPPHLIGARMLLGEFDGLPLAVPPPAPAPPKPPGIATRMLLGIDGSSAPAKPAPARDPALDMTPALLADLPRDLGQLSNEDLVARIAGKAADAGGEPRFMTIAAIGALRAAGRITPEREALLLGIAYHHEIPQAIYRRFNLSPEVRAIFNRHQIFIHPEVANLHRYDAIHRAYNDIQMRAFEIFLNGQETLEQPVTEAQAEAFARRHAENPPELVRHYNQLLRELEHADTEERADIERRLRVWNEQIGAANEERRSIPHAPPPPELLPNRRRQPTRQQERSAGPAGRSPTSPDAGGAGRGSVLRAGGQGRAGTGGRLRE